MPRVGFEHTIPAFENAKLVHALDSAATVVSGAFLQPHTIVNLGLVPSNLGWSPSMFNGIELSSAHSQPVKYRLL
jgi:hypothetical protein